MKAISISINGGILFFFNQERWPRCLSTKNLQMQVEFDNLFLSLLLFDIEFNQCTKILSFRCYLQYAGGGKNSGGSSIPQLWIPFLSLYFASILIFS